MAFTSRNRNRITTTITATFDNFKPEIFEEIRTLPNDDSDSELESSSDDHWINNSSLDSKAETEVIDIN
ncbi:hypothetical protein CsSME_00022936 [Camellia sinensis var. sinensis]